MVKAFLKYLLLFCILLLSGRTQAFAQTHQERTQNAAIQHLKASTNAEVSALPAHANYAPKAYLSGTKKETLRLDLTEGELTEIEFSALKKYTASSNFLTAIFYAQILAYFLGYFKRFLAFSKHFSYSSSYRWFLLFRVFRI